MEKDKWTNRDTWLEQIRDEEINKFREIYIKILLGRMHINKPYKIIDLGCGKDKYLQHQLNITDGSYIGIDIVEEADICTKIENLPKTFFGNDNIIISMGLMYLLDYQVQKAIYDNCDYCILQCNHEDTKNAHKILKMDRKEGYIVWPTHLLELSGQPEKFIKTELNTYGDVKYIPTSVSYIIYKGLFND